MMSKNESVLSAIIKHLDGLDRQPCIDTIDDLIHRLQFERRWRSLRKNQRQHMLDESLSDAAKEALSRPQTEEERDERISMYARAMYFRRCAWMEYLHGESDNPPIEAAEKGEDNE